MPTPLSRILHVEDQPDIRLAAKMALDAVVGFTVNVCVSGQETLSSTPAAKADLLLDVVMPGIDGLSTIQALAAIADARLVSSNYCSPVRP